MTNQQTARPWIGTYLVQGHDAKGPWAYPGKGDPQRAYASMHGRGGKTVTILSAGQSEKEAYATETALIMALKVAGVRLLNGPGGHHASSLSPAVLLGASLNPAGGGPRRRLTLAKVGTAILVPANLLHGHREDDIRQSTFQAWKMGDAAISQLRRLLAAGKPVRLLAVTRGGIVVDACRITAVRTFPAGHDHAGFRYFGLADDPEATVLTGHYAPVGRQQNVRYLTAAEASITAFLKLP